MLLDRFIEFLEHPTASEMYIEGGAGTGKTTSLGELVLWLIEQKKGHNVCAYTHKAVEVLAGVMPPKANMSTLHKYLAKVPTVNTSAVQVSHVDGNSVVGESELIEVLFVDEFSMVGDRDYVDIKALQYSHDGRLITKVVYIGDRYQLPPVKDKQTVIPNGEFVIYLTEVFRQADTNQLLDTLIKLQGWIDGSVPITSTDYIAEHSTFLRKRDIVNEYLACEDTDKTILAYTNERVEQLNARIQGRVAPFGMDDVFSPTVRKVGKFLESVHNPKSIKPIYGEVKTKDTKFNPLKTLASLQGVEFMLIEELHGDDYLQMTRAVVFGHKKYKDMLQRLNKIAVDANRRVEFRMGQGTTIQEWCKYNPDHPLTKERAKAWREKMTFSECVICLDFIHATTVHKAQGSTYNTVFVDTQDLSRCIHINSYFEYLRLMYVSISRARSLVITS